jgi:fused signal recognition particle receptor
MGWFDRLRQGLSRSREQLNELAGPLGVDLKEVVSGSSSASLEELQDALLLADVGQIAASEILEDLKASGSRDLRQALSEALTLQLEPDARRAQLRRLGFTPDARRAAVVPRGAVIMVVGVNGVGKTTTVAKLGAYYRAQGRSVLFAAGDTFRAAATEQLAIWGDRLGIPVTRGAAGSDPAAVAFDAATARRVRGLDLLLVDTAGRLHTKHNLMEELRKVVRVIDKADPGEPAEIWLVLDASTGQNGLLQAQAFHQAVKLSGVVVTKLDGTARGGILVQVVRELGLPIKFIGVGESQDDLQPFDAREFVAALLD